MALRAGPVGHRGAPYLRIEEVSVDHSPLDVVEVTVVLQSPLQQARLLTELSYVRPVVMSEHLVSQDGICDLCNSESGKRAAGGQ